MLDTCKYPMFDTFKNRLEITGKLTTITALRISAGRSSEPTGSDLPVIKDALDRPLIPGSSFKGALRSRLESFLRGINPKLAANPAIEAEWSITNDLHNQLKEEVEAEPVETRDQLLTQKIIQKTDLVSRLFGSPWIASKFQVRDLTVDPNSWFDQYEERDGVAIDRDTETAADGKLYDFQVVPAATEFKFRAVVENAEPHELGLLMIGLHQFATEQIPLGGGRSRGLGVVRLDIDKMRWIDVEGDPDKLITYLQALVSGDADKNSPYEDGKQHKDTWIQALINHLRENIAKSSPTPQNSSGD